MRVLNYLAILLAALTAVAGLPAPALVRQRDLSKLTYLGSYRSGPAHHSVRDKRSAGQESFYFRSQNAVRNSINTSSPNNYTFLILIVNHILEFILNRLVGQPQLLTVKPFLVPTPAFYTLKLKRNSVT